MCNQKSTVMNRLTLGCLVVLAVASMSVAMMGCDKKIENSALNIDDVKGEGVIELVMGSMRSASSSDYTEVPAGAKVIVKTTERSLFNTMGDKTIIVREVSLSGKSCTLKLPASVRGTEYTLEFTASDAVDYEEGGKTKKYYYTSPEQTVTISAGSKEAKTVIYTKDTPAEL